MSTNKPAAFIKSLIGTLYIPVLIYAAMYIIAHAKGLTFFGDAQTWQNLIQSFAATVTIAFALAIQLKHGRFDFSGGAVMTLGAILSVTITQKLGGNWVLLLICSLIVCTILSTLVGCLYVYGRLPVVIATIGAAILFESITLMINGGRGISISATTSLNVLGKTTGACIILAVVSGAIYYFFNTYTIVGMHLQLLSNNQLAAVNIGINESRTILTSFMVSGFLYGFATVIYASQSAAVSSVSSTLGTVSTAFGAILPVFMGLYIGHFSNDFIGLLFAAFAIGTFRYGLSIISPSGYAGAVTNIVYGIFLVVFFLISHQGAAILAWCKEQLHTEKAV